jgi:hypothetical protein
MATLNEVPASETEFRMSSTSDDKHKEHDDATIRKQRSLGNMDAMHKNLISAMSVSSLGVSLSKTSTTHGINTPPSRSSSNEMSHDEEEAAAALLSQSVEIKGKKNRNIKHGVSFGNVHVREHERTVGYNPCVSSGPALDLSWKYNDQTIPPTSVDDFEHMRTYIAPRRNKSDLILYRMEREKILKFDNDVSRSEIAAAVRSINKTKSNRRQTLNNLKYHHFEQTWEKMKRSGQRAIGIRKSTHQEIKSLWKNAEKNLEKSARKKERSSSSGSRSGMFKSKSEKKSNGESEHISDSSRSRRRLFKKEKEELAEPSLSDTNHRYKRDVGVSSSTKHVKEYDLTPDADDSLSNSKHVKNYDLGLDASISSSKHVKKYDLGLDPSSSHDDSNTPTTSNHGALRDSLGSESASGADVNSDEQVNNDDAVIQVEKKQREESSSLANKIKIRAQSHNSKDMDNRTHATDLSVSCTSRDSSPLKQPLQNQFPSKRGSVGIIAVEEDLFD